MSAMAPLLPHALVSSWTSMSDEQFRRAAGSTPLLVIDFVNDLDLLNGLEAASTVAGETITAHRDKLAFRTVVRESSASLIEAAMERKRTFERRLGDSMHFVAPLRKRPGGDEAFTERIMVGRAFSTDVVLRHESVSKLHAWFECDEEGTYYVGDPGSRNGTTINGEKLKKLEPMPIKDGDIVVFGDVHCFFCRPPRVRALLASTVTRSSTKLRRPPR
jgi:hypothetical protein